jgi:hypothetical protein
MGVPAPVIDVGTFAVGRMGVSGHPVGWAWGEPTQAGTVEHFALYMVGDPFDGFLRPGATSEALGYRFSFVPDPLGAPLQHVDVPAFKAFVTAAARNCGMDPAQFTYVRADLAPPGQNAPLAAAFLDPGFVRVRHAPDPASPTVAWALRSTGQFVERWLVSNDPVRPYRLPSLGAPSVAMWFHGQPEVGVPEFTNAVLNESAGNVAPAADYNTIDEP